VGVLVLVVLEAVDGLELNLPVMLEVVDVLEGTELLELLELLKVLDGLELIEPLEELLKLPNPEVLELLDVLVYNNEVRVEELERPVE
jgi:hypothetical protein